MDRADLIAALEKAEGPSRELDAQIHTQCGVIDEGHCNSWCRMDGRTDLTRDHFIAAWAPCYTASLDAALSLVPEGDREVIVAMRSNRKPCAEISSFPGYVSAHGATPAIALVIAALRAMD